MAIIIEAVNEYYGLSKQQMKKLFLAGGITNCPNWQKDIISKIKDIDNLIVYNPRRNNFPIGDQNAAIQQIVWEYEHLESADIIVFWFSNGSLNPIVLYELGRWGNSTKKDIIVGIDTEYERKQDVVIQTLLSRPDTRFVYTIPSLADNIRDVLNL